MSFNEWWISDFTPKKSKILEFGKFFSVTWKSVKSYLEWAFSDCDCDCQIKEIAKKWSNLSAGTELTVSNIFKKRPSQRVQNQIIQ